MKLGSLYKQAEQFEKLQKELPVLIKLSNVNKQELFKRCRIAETHFYRKLNARSFNAEQLIRIFTAIIEMENFEIANQ